MYFSLKGLITHLLNTSIVINVNDVSYEIFVCNTNRYKIGDVKTIFTYLYTNELEKYLIGFDDLNEKKVFISLISVKGIGPKTALNILGNCDINELLNAINTSNFIYLKKLPGIGNKTASQIILDLKGKLNIEGDEKVFEVRNALKNLGFRLKDIDLALSKINFINLNKEEALKESLKLLRK